MFFNNHTNQTTRLPDDSEEDDIWSILLGVGIGISTVTLLCMVIYNGYFSQGNNNATPLLTRQEHQRPLNMDEEMLDIPLPTPSHV